MGLPFLNKKSWHTGSFKNIEQVWIAEEKHREKLKKQEELKKKLVEEKYNEDFKKLQVEAGLIPRSELDKMDWMYNFYGHGEAENNAEEYLLGKKVEKIGEEDKNVASLKNRKMRFNDTIDDTNDNKNDANEDFIRIQEDPLFQIRREEMMRKQQILNNPVKMKAILQELEAKEKIHKERKKKRKEKKEKKKKKKSKDRKSRSRSRSKSKKKRKKEKKGKEREDSTSVSSHNDDKMFNDFVKKRLGPLVEFDEDTYRLRFTAKHKFKNNDRRKMTKEEKDDLLKAMKRNAEMYEKKKLEAHIMDLAEDEKNEKKGKPNFLQEYSKGVVDRKGVDQLAENLNRSRYFVDQNAVRRDDYDV